MSKLIADDALRSKFGGLAGPLEVCDEAGRTLGHLLPDDLYRELVHAWADAQISDAELNRRRAEPARPLAEIWKSLGRS